MGNLAIWHGIVIKRSRRTEVKFLVRPVCRHRQGHGQTRSSSPRAYSILTQMMMEGPTLVRFVCKMEV